MTREEAIEILENGEWWEEISEWYKTTNAEHDKLHDAVDMAISALRQQETVTNRNGLNDPLTLDELRQMGGEPVWVEFQDGSGGKWGIVHITRFNQIVFANGLHCTIGEPYYGKTWLAYRQKPEKVEV